MGRVAAQVVLAHLVDEVVRMAAAGLRLALLLHPVIRLQQLTPSQLIRLVEPAKLRLLHLLTLQVVNKLLATMLASLLLMTRPKLLLEPR